MVKFDPDGFDAMMARIAAEQEAESPYEDLEPDYEYIGAHLGVSVTDQPQPGAGPVITSR